MLLKSIFLLCSLISIPAASSAEIVEFPDDAFWRSIGRSLNEGEPDFEVLAKRSARYREANEFSRAAVLEDEISRLMAEYEAFGPDLQVRLRANIRLGDYDASRGGFPISYSLLAPICRLGQVCSSQTPVITRSCQWGGLRRRKSCAIVKDAAARRAVCCF